MERIKTALVTGSSGGIGEAIAKELLDLGYEVYGIGRDFSKSSLENSMYHPMVCDLLHESMRDKALSLVPQNIDVLVNNAGVAYYGMHEELSTEKIQEITRLNLEVPMILCAKYIRKLRESHGTIINISSVTATHSAPHGACYGASKAGLLSFSQSLLEENRKQGVRVTCILPDMTDTNLYRNADFTADTEEGCALRAEDVAEAVRYVLTQREGMIIPEIMLQPQFHRIKRKAK